MPIDLVAIASAPGRIRKFVEADLPTLLVEFDLRAASSVLKGVDVAADKRSVLWSAVNHLEAAEAKYDDGLASRDRYNKAGALLYIIALRALLLSSLGEHKLVEACFNKSRAIVALHNANAQESGLIDFIDMINIAKTIRIIRQRYFTKFGQAAEDFNASGFWSSLGFGDGSGLGLVYLPAHSEI